MTRAETLNAIVRRVGSAARYTIESAGASRRIVIDNPETGDRVGAVGDSMDAAIAALDAKVPGGPVQEPAQAAAGEVQV